MHLMQCTALQMQRSVQPTCRQPWGGSHLKTDNLNYQMVCALYCRFAFGWVLVLTCLLVLGTKESARFNLVSVFSAKLLGMIAAHHCQWTGKVLCA
jgi:hypothetical protein